MSTPRGIYMKTSGDLIPAATIPGFKGEKGDTGPQGPEGPPGEGSYYQEVGFASPGLTWVIEHNLDTYGLTVETFDLNGDPLEGGVRYVSANVVEVDWYYPTAGFARLFG